jgi:hypothetical protein
MVPVDMKLRMDVVKEARKRGRTNVVSGSTAFRRACIVKSRQFKLSQAIWLSLWSGNGSTKSGLLALLSIIKELLQITKKPLLS